MMDNEAMGHDVCLFPKILCSLHKFLKRENHNMERLDYMLIKDSKFMIVYVYPPTPCLSL